MRRKSKPWNLPNEVDTLLIQMLIVSALSTDSACIQKVVSELIYT